MCFVRQLGAGAAVAALAFAISGAPATGANPAQAWTLKTLHAFTGGSDGGQPRSVRLVRNNLTGELYGTTLVGGSAGCGGGGCGVVFKLAQDGAETVLYTFTGKEDGYYPPAGLVRDKAGNLYGTTEFGGDHDANCGVIFKLAANGRYTLLHTFMGGANDGCVPEAALTRDEATGDLYGATAGGGADHNGAVFKLAKEGTFTVLHFFAGGSQGAEPFSGVTMDRNGDLYGTASVGGDLDCVPEGCGVVYKLARDGTYTVLYAFDRKSQGFPAGGLTLDGAGNLYGTGISYKSNRGSVFKLAPDGAFEFLHFFKGQDGAAPAGDLLRERSGTIYGTTLSGGDADWGVVYQLEPDGAEDVLHSFGYGAGPVGGVIADKDGNLYGTTQDDAGGHGTVFELVK